MKKLLIVCTCLISAALFAVQSVLFDWIPASSEGAIYLDADAIRAIPEVAAELKKPENAEKFAPFDCLHEVLCFTVSHPVINAAVIRVAPQLDPEKQLTDAKMHFKRMTIAGLPAWEFDCAGEEKLVGVQLSREVYLLADDVTDATRLLKKPRGNAVTVLNQAALLPVKDAPVWFVDTHVKLPVQSRKKGDPDMRGNLRFCLTPVSGPSGVRICGVVDCPDKSSASQVMLLSQLACNMATSALFGENPDLAQKVMAAIKMKVVEAECRIDAEIMQDLVEKVHGYLQTRNVLETIQNPDALPAF